VVRGPAPNVAWSTDVDQADWIRSRLASFGNGRVDSVVPREFVAYARILHPVYTAYAPKPVRWREVATWSGRSLQSDSEFHSVAFPVEEVSEPAPWGGQGPRHGTLDAADAEALVRILAHHTSTSDHCWFCIWNGYGWSGRSRAMLTAIGEPSPPPEPVPDPIPAHVRAGPTVQLPEREYYLYSGPIDGALAFVPSERQTPNLFWPADCAWCVASEIDLSWSYVGGSEALIEDLVTSQDIEALRVEPDSPLGRVEPWVVELVKPAVETVLSGREATIETAQGTVHAVIEHGRFFGRDTLVTSRFKRDGGGTGRSVLGRRGTDLRREVTSHLERAIIELVE
jgi:hypothetical protein